MALAVACLKLSMENPAYAFVAVHVNHGLRGAESDGDQAFVEAFCSACHLQCVVKKVDVATKVKVTGQSVEEAARELRYRALTEAAMQNMARKILTAHHANDQAETVLMRLIRGSGMKGLGAMRRDNGFVLRPLLDFTKAELEEYCRNNGVNWVEDSSNQDLDYSRNYLRQRLMPLLEKLNPHMVYQLCKLAESAQEDEEVLQELAEQLAKERFCGDQLNVQDWHMLPAAVCKRVIRKWLMQFGMEPNWAHTNAVHNLILTGTSNKEVALPGVTVKYAYHMIYALLNKQHIRY